MRLVIDANVLFSALIKDSFTARLIFEESLELYSASFVVDEFMKYEDLLLRKTHRTREEFITVLHQLHEIISVVREEGYSAFMERAIEISPDERDASYFALALRLGCGIWSNDKKLQEQDVVDVYTTSELMDVLAISAG